MELFQISFAPRLVVVALLETHSFLGGELLAWLKEAELKQNSELGFLI